ncbi:MAG: hypothetical protein AAGF50_05890 [Pseudomonadota bacterium]
MSPRRRARAGLPPLLSYPVASEDARIDAHEREDLTVFARALPAHRRIVLAAQARAERRLKRIERLKRQAVTLATVTALVGAAALYVWLGTEYLLSIAEDILGSGLR